MLSPNNQLPQELNVVQPSPWQQAAPYRQLTMSSACDSTTAYQQGECSGVDAIAHPPLWGSRAPSCPSAYVESRGDRWQLGHAPVDGSKQLNWTELASAMSSSTCQSTTSIAWFVPHLVPRSSPHHAPKQCNAAKTKPCNKVRNLYRTSKSVPCMYIAQHSMF